VIDPNLAAEIESCSFLYLRELREPREKSVLLVLDEAIIGAPAPNVTIGNKTFNNLCNIEVNTISRAFELLWDEYIAYSVRNESFAQPGFGEEILSGHCLCVYTKSHFLDYIAKATWGDADYPGLLLHVGVRCLNHVVDVASIKPPKIRRLR